ncbi:MAG: class I SAM-dependent methyltransferase, partial [Sphaerochaetaceae bacterium]
MAEKRSIRIFNLIAPIYGLFFTYQKNRYSKNLEAMQGKLDLSNYHSIIDVGCGTGALCNVLGTLGLKVTGVDSASRMLSIAKQKTNNPNIAFYEADLLQGCSFKDNQFDIAIASYVAHGIEREQRKKLYREMSRIARHLVIIHDYNQRRSVMTSLIEWLEGGDYFHFINHAETE